MKRLLLAAGLTAVITTAWTVYPSRAHSAADGGYLLVTSRYIFSGFGSKGMLTITTPTGEVQTQEIEVKSGTPGAIGNSLDQLHRQEVKKLNELRTAGWRVKTATQTAVGAVSETNYLLEKE